jgi:hypothetical protein
MATLYECNECHHLYYKHELKKDTCCKGFTIMQSGGVEHSVYCLLKLIKK